ncbi:hypothetical protein ES703_104433 [subsurface metagenome]
MSTKTKDRIEKNELLRGAGISSDTLHNWIRMGLLPAWVSYVFYGAQGSRSWYPVEALELARKVKAWREQGIGYRAIRELLKSEGAEL